MVGAIGADHDQIAAPPRCHPRQHPVDEALGADEVDLHLEQESLRVHLAHQGEFDIARTGDEDLGGAVRALGGRHELVHGRGIGDVESVRVRLAAVGADLGGDLLAQLDSTRAQRHRMPELGQRDGARGADAGGGAGYQHGPAVGMGFESGH